MTLFNLGDISQKFVLNITSEHPQIQRCTILDVTFLCCIALSMPSPIMTNPIKLTVKVVVVRTSLSITATPNAVVPMSAPPTIRRVVVVTFDLFFSRISIPKARKNKIIDDMPTLDIPNGHLSIFAGKNPCLIKRSADPSAIWISNKAIAAMARISDIWRLRVLVPIHVISIKSTLVVML